MRLGIQLCIILLILFSIATAGEVKTSSGMNENDSSFGLTSGEDNEFSEGAEPSTELPVEVYDDVSNETDAGIVAEAPSDEAVEDTEKSAWIDPDEDTEPAFPEEDSFKKTPAEEIFEHFKPDEDENFGLSSEETVETETESNLKPEPVQSSESLESLDEAAAALEKKEKDREEQVKLNNEYEQLNRKKEALDLEFKALDEERNKLVEARKGLKTNEDVLEYNNKTEALNEKLKQYDEKQKVYDVEVQDFNNRVKQDMERKIKEAEAQNIETNYESFDKEADSSFEINPYERLDVDKFAPIEEQREAFLKYKAQIESEYQMLMKQRSEIDKEKNLVKTIEDVNALNKKAFELNKRIVEFEKKRIYFDKELNEFNSRMESGLKAEQEAVEE